LRAGDGALTAELAGWRASQSVRGGTLPGSWWAASRACIGRPDFQFHQYNSDLYILRQTASSHAEKPFLYLLFGRSIAILFDTGVESDDIKTAVDNAVRHWLQAHDRRSIPLTVTHLHSHFDHIAGDSQLAQLPDTTVIPTVA
jgi:glyoxylase-like metal-dependent hydrolase (beta-lactamase superfamily II)